MTTQTARRHPLGLVRSLATAGLLLAGCVGAGEDPSTDPTVHIQQESVYRTDGWGSSSIRVCWVNPTAANQETRSMAQLAVIGEFGLKTRIRFTGWDACAALGAAGETEIRISIGTEWPNSMVGPTVRGTTMGIYDINDPANSGTGGGWQGTLFHEFGHAVGLHHEQNRSDSICRRSHEPATSTAAIYGPYDPASLMNYCNNTLTGLSTGDLLTLQRMFGSTGLFHQFGSTVYRFTRSTAASRSQTMCRVVDATQMSAFGGTRLIGTPDGAPWTIGESGAPTNLGDCPWPDGFYRTPDARVYFAQGSNVCWVESPAQLEGMGGPGVALNVPNATFAASRIYTGPCRWSDGFYQTPDTRIYQVQGANYCWVSDPYEIEALGGAEMVRQIPADATFRAGRTNTGLCQVGNWAVVNGDAGQFAQWSVAPGVRVLRGDFNGDSLTDIALTGVAGWATIPIAVARGDGTFRIENPEVGSNFAFLASEPGVRIVAGDFDANGRADIALMGRAGWNTIVVALSVWGGGFQVVNRDAAALSYLVQQGARVHAGDFDGDGDDDIALTGVAGWDTVPLGLSDGTGSFVFENRHVGSTFVTWASTPGAVVLAGDFNGVDADGRRRADLVVAGVAGWTTMPTAITTATGFTVTNPETGVFAEAFAQAGRIAAVGDFDGNGIDDIALSGGADWTTLPVAFGAAAVNWPIENAHTGVFRHLARTPGAVLVSGRFDRGNTRSDLAITGVSGWTTLPVALRRSGP